MKSFIKTKVSLFDKKCESKVAYRVFRWLLKVLFKVTKLIVWCLGMVIAILVFRVKPDDLGSDDGPENRTADDIWGLSSGNDYYGKEPPDSFS